MKARSTEGDVTFALGTAQLGMNYGVANQSGQPDFDLAREIVQTAASAGCRYLDTAAAYGESEKVLGRILATTADRDDLAVITKAALRVAGQYRSGEITEAVRQSLQRLNSASIWALLLHREEDLATWSDGLEQELAGLRADKLVQHVGVSLYSPSWIPVLLKMPEIDVVQVPCSIFDRRFVQGAADLMSAGKKVFLRSVFLQGLALMDVARVPAKLGFAQPALQALEDFCRQHSLSRRQWALDYVRLRCPGAILIFGAERPDQVLENTQALQRIEATSDLCDAWDECWSAEHDEALCPVHWPR
jgi:aryl-alcohol dehydrogenase-like predicted oxidoreductase